MFMTNWRRQEGLLIIAMVATMNACAIMQPAEVNGPKGGGPPYPVILTEQAQRRELSAIAFKHLTSDEGDKNGVYLQPVTATLKSLPGSLATPLYLPKVGINAEMNEEETRESLRRFINDWQNLIGSDPAVLTLVERVDLKDGRKVAKYEQRPFRYPLRGAYGKLEIQFTADRRLLNVSSTCIPDAERLQPAIAAVIPLAKSEDAITHVKGKVITYADSSGTKQQYQTSSNSEITATDLVIYPIPSSTNSDALEFHLAWEFALKNAPISYLYIDAIEDKVLAAG